MTQKALTRPFLLSAAIPMLLLTANVSEARATFDQAPVVLAQFEAGGGDLREERRREREQLREERRERRLEERRGERERRREDRRLERDELRDLPREERRRRRDELREERRPDRSGPQRERSQDQERIEDLGLPDERERNSRREPRDQEPPPDGRF